MNHCPHCQDTGYRPLESPSGRMVDNLCSCRIGYDLGKPFIGPPEPTSAWLSDNEFDKHRAAMKAEGRYECWHCPDWHEADTECPEINHGGWTAENIGELTFRIPERMQGEMR